MNATMYIVLSTEDKKIYEDVCNELKSFYSPLSISPYRPYPRMKDSIEFYITFSIDKDSLSSLLNKLSNCFDEGEYGDEWECYGITSHVFHKDVYYIHIDAFD